MKGVCIILHKDNFKGSTEQFRTQQNIFLTLPFHGQFTEVFISAVTDKLILFKQLLIKF